jgi:hypothetical protein
MLVSSTTWLVIMNIFSAKDWGLEMHVLEHVCRPEGQDCEDLEPSRLDGWPSQHMVDHPDRVIPERKELRSSKAT